MRRTLGLMVGIFLVLVPATATAVVADAPDSCSSGIAASAKSVWLSDSIDRSTDVDWFKFTLSKDKYVQIVLGGLPANYQLALFNPCGTKLASSNRSGRVYEEIDRSLAAGTYYVRVMGVAGKSNAKAYKLRFRPLPAGQAILSTKSYVDSLGYRHVVGEALNNTNAKRTYVEIDATLYNSSNKVVGTDFTYTWVDILGPHQRSPFELIFDPPAGYDHYRLTVSSSTTSQAPIQKLHIAKGVPSTDGIGYRHYPGEITNNNSFSVQFTEAIVTLYDKRGAVKNVDFTFTSPDQLGPGDTAPYDATFGSHYAGVNRYVVLAQAIRV